MTLERCPVPQLSELKVQPGISINTGLMSLFNLQLMTLERCPAPPLSELRVPPLTERNVRLTNSIKTC